jgi:hypothetical protein
MTSYTLHKVNKFSYITLNNNLSVSPSSYERKINGKRISKNACLGLNVTCPLPKQDFTLREERRLFSLQDSGTAAIPIKAPVINTKYFKATEDVLFS